MQKASPPTSSSPRPLWSPTCRRSSPCSPATSSPPAPPAESATPANPPLPRSWRPGQDHHRRDRRSGQRMRRGARQGSKCPPGMTCVGPRSGAPTSARAQRNGLLLSAARQTDRRRIRRPRRCSPGWSRRHVVAHVGYNARALTRLVEWAKTGIETPMYASADQSGRRDRLRRHAQPVRPYATSITMPRRPSTSSGATCPPTPGRAGPHGPGPDVPGLRDGLDAHPRGMAARDRSAQRRKVRRPARRTRRPAAGRRGRRLAPPWNRHRIRSQAERPSDQLHPLAGHTRSHRASDDRKRRRPPPMGNRPGIRRCDHHARRGRTCTALAVTTGRMRQRPVSADQAAGIRTPHRRPRAPSPGHSPAA